MFSFGKTSADRLATCDEKLRLVMQEAIRTSPMDFTIVCGHRGEAEQTKACEEGKSKTPWPTSKHNGLPSKAVDIAPYREGVGIVWSDDALWKQLADHVMATAERLGIALRWGGDFNGDGDKTTSDAWDKPHFELKGC